MSDTVRVKIKAIECIDTEDFVGSDEVYVVVLLTTLVDGKPKTFSDQLVIGDMKEEDRFTPDEVVLEKEIPSADNAVVTLIVVDQDLGGPPRQLKNIVEQIQTPLGSGLGEVKECLDKLNVVPEKGSSLVIELLDWLVTKIIDAFNGDKDDILGVKSVTLPDAMLDVGSTTIPVRQNCTQGCFYKADWEIFIDY